MATGLIYYDGFEDTTDITQYYVRSGSNLTISTSASRSGAAGLRYTGSSNGWLYRPHATVSTIIAGCAFRYSSMPSNSTSIFFFDDNATRQFQLKVSAGFKLEVRRGTTLLATGTTVLMPNVWYFIEIKVVFHNTAGAYEVRINGVTELTATSQNTRSSANNSADRTGTIVDGGGGSNTYDIDDLYIVDGGVAGADFLGDIRVDSSLVTADGTHTDFAIGGTAPAATRHESVDDTTPDDGVTTITSGTVGDKASFTVGATTGSGSVFGVAVVHRSQKDDAGPRSLTPFLLRSGTETDGSAVAQTTSFVSQFQNFDDAPGATGWTIAQVNATEPGVLVAA